MIVSALSGTAHSAQGMVLALPGTPLGHKFAEMYKRFTEKCDYKIGLKVKHLVTLNL